MAKKYKYSYYVFDSKEDYDLFLELIKFHGCTGKYSGYDRNEIYYFVRDKFDPNEINKRKLLGTEIKYIRLGLERNFDVSIYAKPELNHFQMTCILMGLEKGFDVSIYAKPEFDNKQMHEIYMGLLNDVNVLLYATSKLDWNEMRTIRWELEGKNKKT
jgi:hypothetical protein